MPEYLAPGVYVEETSFRQKTIEGVSTSTAGFIGPARFGPSTGEPELLTSFFEFERIYGGLDPLDWEDHGDTPNDLAHAVRGFFENGGRRLYVVRTYEDGATGGFASYVITTGVSGGIDVLVRARHPGAAGNIGVTIDVKAGQNILTTPTGSTHAVLSGARQYDVVLVSGGSPPGPNLYWLEEHFDAANQLDTYRLRRPGDTPATAPLASELTGVDVHVITVAVTVDAMGRFMDARTWEELNPDPRHRDEALLTVFAAEPRRRATELYVPIIVGPDPLDTTPSPLADGVTVLESLLAELVASTSPAVDTAGLLEGNLVPPPASTPVTPRPVQFQFLMTGGSDGNRPGVSAYEGDEDDKSGLFAFEDIDDISIVAAPGSTRAGLNGRQAETASIQQLVISHCERMRYRIAVLDAPDEALVSDIRSYRAQMDSKHAAIYYPWVTIVDPVSEEEMNTPPSGFVSGIYARNDIERGVHKAPANEVVRLAIGFEYLLNKAQQDVLNPEGVNCLRFFEGRGHRVWGARTITFDGEWKYVPLRRYFAFLEHSIDKGTQWAVFEPNGRILWSKVRRTVEDFLFNEWKSGHLMGETPEEAYFVKCDRTTMTQSDFDNGRMICVIGVAPLRPAEFVIFRIGQKTLESRG
ncbi:MAG: phage tail sheath subtilisin-like domain-containing protein [Acidimicrobiia bacterium]|nr:phage tail sheath subtilisin-like domain-containing protein [Acidimicrobiia bacterium]